ncbi:MAG: ABC transporter ATP-binding protein [Eubacteriales bacterium]|nr:ABC transporter ATP-binding protein [Eubacteriales bacterium]
MPEIILENISKRFGKFVAIENLNLKMSNNSFITLLGPSGCGKTTTLRMIAGLETPTEGRITIDNETVFDSEKGINMPPIKRNVGFLFQNYALWPHMTVFENIAFGLQNLKWDKEKIRSRVRELLVMLHIEEFEHRYPSELSGGQQQRVAIARTLAPSPKALFMDEPLSNLDAKLRMEMRAELKRLHRSTDSTFVYVTHDQLEAMTLSTAICIMKEGVLQQYDKPLNMYNNPSNLFVADFMGNPTMNFLNCEVKNIENGMIKLQADGNINGTVEFKNPLEEKEYTMGIRPEYININSSGRYEGTVYATLPSGMETTVKLDVNGTTLTAVVFGDRDYSIDSKVKFDISREIILFDKQTGQNVLRALLNPLDN